MSKYVKSYNLKPTIYKSRSKFPLNHSHKTMFNEGDLVPILVQEVYPGDTFSVDTNFVVRTTAPFIRPIMDNLFIDIRYFFIPNRLVYDKWPEVMGENKSSAWAPESYAEVPQVSGKLTVGSVADYMGIKNASSLNNVTVSRLPFRAFGLVYDEWYRDQNLQQPMLINKSATDSTTLNGNPWAPNNIYGMPPKVNKLHDYFTSCLPAPQKGNAVSFPLNGVAPVVTTNLPSQFAQSNGAPLYWMFSNSNEQDEGSGFIGLNGGETRRGADPAPAGGTQSIVPQNLIIRGEDLGASINDLRMAGALQRLLEKDARGGTRYTEYIQEHFGVINPDARLQRTEYLGGSRQPLALQQVQQTSQSSAESPLAQVGASSLTNGRSGFTKGFTEHGFILGLACVKQFHTYQQGLERFWTRKSRYDFYDPVFANIGEQPVYESEIYCTGANTKIVFGYNEAWADLRYRPSRVSGMLTSQAGEGFDIWHLGDKYDSAPVLGSEWIKESNNIDRCLSVPSTTAPNFVADFYFRMNAIRELPTYSIPGLFDHN